MCRMATMYDVVYHVKADGMWTNCIRVTYPLQSVIRGVMHMCRLDTIMMYCI